MSTPSVFRTRCFAAWAMPAVLLMLGGCTYGGGELLYMLGFGKAQKVPAEFELTDGPILIFVDDFNEELTWPLASRYLFDALSQELLKQGAAKKIIPLETLNSVRSTRPDFGKLGAREIGVLCGADQVIWIEVKDFLAEERVYSASDAAYFRVTVKVLNPKEKKRRSRVRLWPVSPSGCPVETGISGARVSELKVKAAIAKLLAEDLSVKIAKLFYEHRLGDFEKTK